MQTSTPHQLLLRPSEAELVKAFANKPLTALRTPAFVINRSIFAQNCARMHTAATSWGASFRAHLKTHKTIQGTRLQLSSSTRKTTAVVVSTLMEAWEVVRGGLFEDGTVRDLLYGLPVGPNKIADLAELWDAVEPSGGVIRLLVDHPDQVTLLEDFEKSRIAPRRWSVFVKIDGGQKRAGVSTQTKYFEELMLALFDSPAVSVFGFYCHAGNAYASKSLSDASGFLSAEVDAANTAAGLALGLLERLNKEAPAVPFVLAVGSTPTAHAASAETVAKLAQVLNGTIELHAGNYPMLDLQQQSTSMVDPLRIAQFVVATVVSLYPGRGEEGTDEALIDGGAIAFSKDTGPSGDFGAVSGTHWRLGRLSQEHGILTIPSSATRTEADSLKIGDQVRVIGQHACLIAAAYPWYYIVDSDVDSGERVVDVWVPWKGW